MQKRNNYEIKYSQINWKLVLFILILSLVLRLAWAFYLDPGKFYFDDSAQWSKIAVNFLEGKGFIVSQGARAVRPPLYSLFLSGIYFLFEKENFLAVRITQAGISSLNCFIIYLLALTIFTRRTARIAMIVSSIYPFFIYYSGAVLSETLYIFLLSLLVLALVQKRVFLSGIMFGLTCLCRFEIVPFIIFMVIALFITCKPKEALKGLVALIVLAVLVVSPWILRNYFVFKRFIPFTTMGGLVLYAGNNPMNITGGGITGRDFQVPEAVSGMSEIERDQYLKKEAFNFMRNNPGKVIELWGKKFKYFWNIKLNTTNPRYATRLTNLVAIFSFSPVLFLFLIGLLFSWWNRKKLVYLYFLISSTTLVYLIFIASLRYRLPIEPYMIIIASYTFSLLFEKEQKKDV